MGAGTGTPFRDKPPRLSRKGALRAGSSVNNAPLRDNRGGGGGLVSKGCVEYSSVSAVLLNCTNFFSSFLFSLRWCGKDNRTQSKKKRKGDYMKHFYLCKINRKN